MHESEKIEEAQYFYDQMKRSDSDLKTFKFNLSAFLSAARSALQFALEESKSKAGGQAWFDSSVSHSQVISFFKDKRDINIHSSPVSVNKNIGIMAHDTITTISDSIKIVVSDAQGSVKNIHSSEPESTPSEPPEDEPPVVTVTHRFDDWPGNENVLQLCAQYLNEVRRIMADGSNIGILSQ